ncbi:MAG: thioesterase [Defluviitaleaceae bacterium]|nr:thioesterase [Defluviitaleaceae bacterium]
MENKFSVDYRIGFNNIMPNLTMNLPGLMHYVQESSLIHTFSNPHSQEYYDSHKLAWVITHWHVKIKRYPLVNSKVKIRTWPVKFRGFFGERGFDVQDENGEILLEANSNWILIERESHKPFRPSEEIRAQYGNISSFPFEKDFSMPQPDTLADFANFARREYVVMRRDIDTNYHANNVRYIEWSFEDVPQDIYHNMQPCELKVAYKKECIAGDKLEILQSIKRKPKEACILADIVKEDSVACQIYTKWREIEN